MRQNLLLSSIISDIFKINSKIRFVSIINLNGKIMTSEMRPELKSLLKNSNEEKFCEDIAIRRKMRHEFDKKLGKVSYVHVERENVTQLVVYSKLYSFFITVEPEITISTKSKIIIKIKSIISSLK
jgi:hypothetical protein|tara:strand:+ start:527 stop:904 length:378 start_codon:yes stop_codon:yes gene_type:complete